MMKIHLTPNDHGNPPGKLADAELHFTEGPLAGLKLIGFSIWETRRGDTPSRNVTFPARSYSVNGERRSFALLRPIVDTTAQGTVRELILAAYAEWETTAHADDTMATCPDCSETMLAWQASAHTCPKAAVRA